MKYKYNGLVGNRIVRVAFGLGASVQQVVRGRSVRLRPQPPDDKLCRDHIGRQTVFVLAGSRTRRDTLCPAMCKHTGS